MKDRQQPRLLFHTLILLGVGCFFILFVTLVQPFYSLNLWLSDQFILSESPSPNIVVVGIDDATLETYGRWAGWPRSLHAQAIDNLSQAGASVIGLDILFSESTTDDLVLAQSIQAAGNVVLPVVGTGPVSSTDSQIAYSRIESPTALFEQSAAAVGHGNLVLDPDGKVRRSPLVVRDSSGQTYPAFGLAVLYHLFAQSIPEQYSSQNGTARLLDREIPVDGSFCYRINYSPEESGRPYLSYGDVISGNFDPQSVAGKIVLVGMSATGELDKWAVPASSGKTSGIFIQAAIIDNILRQQFIAEAGTGVNLLILFLILLATSLVLPRLRLRWGGVLVGAILIIYLVVSFLSYEKGYVLNILYPLLLLAIIYTGSSLTHNLLMTVENSRLGLKVSEGYRSTISALAAAVDAKDHYTRGHSQRVMELALLAARSLDMSPQELKVLEYAGILHDIGKIGIPDKILTKPGHLTPEEFDIIRKHPRLGADMVTDVAFLEGARRLILHHHERYDGKGYPDGLAGEDIPLGARLLAVADAFDSMTSNRSYRTAMSAEVAINELNKCRGTQFCPLAVDAFISALKQSGSDSGHSL